jgi:hypothetical protein
LSFSYKSGPNLITPLSNGSEMKSWLEVVRYCHRSWDERYDVNYYWVHIQKELISDLRRFFVKEMRLELNDC